MGGFDLLANNGARLTPLCLKRLDFAFQKALIAVATRADLLNLPGNLVETFVQVRDRLAVGVERHPLGK